MSKSRQRRTAGKRGSRARPRSPGKTAWLRNPFVVGAAASVAVLAVFATIALFLTGPQIPSFDGERARSDVERLVGFGPRVPGTPPHEAAMNFLRSRLDSLADRVSLQPVFLVRPEGDTVRGTNLIASFNLHPTRNVRLMLGAHWDTRPRADEDPDPANRNKPIPGANDGASGSAVLLEIARLLAAYPPDVGVDMVFFDLEDMGADSTVAFAAGSEQFASANTDYRPTFGIVLDMVCDRDLELRKELNSVRGARRVVDLVWEAARQEGADAFSNRLGGAVTDDHVPFLQRGIPVVDVIQLPFPAYWHTLADTPDRCSAESLGQVGRVVSRVIYTQ